MENPKRRETDQNCQSLQGPKTRDNCEQTRILLQECIEEHSMAPSKHIPTVQECLKKVLDCEFKNPVPQFIRSLIKAITLRSKDKQD